MPLSIADITAISYQAVLRDIREQESRWVSNVLFSRGVQWNPTPIQENFLYEPITSEPTITITCMDDGSEEMGD